MRPEAFDSVVVTTAAGTTPWRSIQTNAAAARLPGVTLMVLLAMLIVGPQIALAGYAIADPALRQTFVDQPVAALQVAAALVFWMAVVCGPLRLAIGKVARRRTVEIRDGQVIAEDVHAFGSQSWAEPLPAYLGIAHHVRTSVSGVRHELVLAHPKRSRSVLFQVSEHISEQDVDAAAQLLGVRKVGAAALYRLNAPELTGCFAAEPRRLPGVASGHRFDHIRVPLAAIQRRALAHACCMALIP